MLAIKLFLAMASMAFALVLMDIGLRVASLGTPRRGVISPRPAPHRLTGWIEVFPPGYTGTLASRDFKVDLRMNGMGLRERDLDLAALGAQRPVVFMGDSYFFGWGVPVEDRLSERLASRLAAVAAPPAPVINLSFPGWSTYHYLDLWDTYFDRLKPRLVVLSCFIGNDFTDDLKQAHRLRADGTLVKEGHEPPKAGLVYRGSAAIRTALSTSPLVGFLQHLLWKSPVFRGLFNRMEMRNDRIALFESESSSLQRQLYAGTTAAYTRLARWSREQRIPVLVVLIPDHLQVLSPELFQGAELRRPQRELEALCAREGLACLDLLPAFQAAPDAGGLFFKEDKHWNAGGHAFVAEALLPVVRDLLTRADAGPAVVPAPAASGR